MGKVFHRSLRNDRASVEKIESWVSQRVDCAPPSNLPTTSYNSSFLLRNVFIFLFLFHSPSFFPPCRECRCRCRCRCSFRCNFWSATWSCRGRCPVSVTPAIAGRVFPNVSVGIAPVVNGLSRSQACQSRERTQSCQFVQVFHDLPLRDVNNADHSANQGIQGGTPKRLINIVPHQSHPPQNPQKTNKLINTGCC